MRLLSLLSLILGLSTSSSLAKAADVEACKEQVRAEKGMSAGQDSNGVCHLRFSGARSDTRSCPGTLLFFSYECRFDGAEKDQICCN